MSKIVYLFGAGASFGKRDEKDKNVILEGLPIVTEFPKQIDCLITRIKKEDTEAKSQFKTNPEELEKLIKELKWLKESSENHQTVDTYAKKLWVTEKTTYDKLKQILSVFLTLEQLFNKPDSRYDAFFANILGNGIDALPKDVTILSWNYDCQFEIAFSNYFSSKSLNYIWEHLNMNAKTVKNSSQNLGFNITKLNGSALAYDKDRLDLSFYDSFFGRQGMSELSHVIASQFSKGSNVRNALSFAWEGVVKDFHDNIIQRVQDAEILVVIGYSFPYFNREVDRKILQSMYNLKKVYIQDPNYIEVKENMEAVLTDSQLSSDNTKFVFKQGLTQFVIPNEM